MTQIDTSVYCPLPFMSLRICPGGEYKICCFSGDGTTSHGYIYDGEGRAMNVMTHTFDQALNASRTLKEIRQYQRDGKRHKECQYCWSRGIEGGQGYGVRPYRQIQSDIKFPAMGIDQTAAEQGISEGKLRSLDLQFTNLCNLSCIHCSPMYSRLWYKDWPAIYGPEFGDPLNRYKVFTEGEVLKSDMVPWHDSGIWKTRFNEVKHDLQHIYLTGGEPFIVKGHQDMLDDLIECDLAKNITLDYDTNLTVINKKILDRLAKFKHVFMRVSFDDVGSRYEFFRYPGKFETLEYNLKYVLQYGPPNLEVQSISTCVGIINVFSSIRMRDWLSSNHLKLNIAPRLLRWPHHFDLKYLLPVQKEKVLGVYEQAGHFSVIKDYLQRVWNSVPEEECRYVQKTHIQYLDKLDGLRGTNWRQAYPETVSLLAIAGCS